MNWKRVGLTGVTCLLAVTGVSAQTITKIVIDKQANYTQTDASTTALNATNPYEFEAWVYGSNLTATSPVSSVSFSGPASGVDSFNAGSGKWDYKQFFSDLAGLDAAFANGVYTMAVGATNVPLNLGGNFTNTPQATVSAGAWTGGVLQLDVSQALTITTNAISGWANDGTFHLGMNINGFGYNPTDTPDTFTASSAAYTIPAFSLTAGDTYTVGIKFAKLSGSSSAYAGATSSAGYNTQTSFTILAVPEPAALEQLLCGATVLAGAFAIRRRRREPPASQKNRVLAQRLSGSKIKSKGKKLHADRLPCRPDFPGPCVRAK